MKYISTLLATSLLQGALGILSLDSEGPCFVGDGDATCIFDHAVVQTPENFEVFVSLDQVAQGENSEALFEITFMNAPFGYAGLKAKAWCVDYDRAITDGFYMTDLYSSYDDDFPGDAVDRPGNLKMVTWLLNNYDVGDAVESCGSDTIEFEDLQIAVWKIVDDETSPSLQAEGTVYEHNECISLYLKDKAFEHDDYEPSCEDPEAVIAVIVVVDDEEVITHQVIVAEILMSDICECPMEEEGEVCYQLSNGTAATDMFAGFVCMDIGDDAVSVRYDIREDYELLGTAVWAGSDIATMPGGSSPDASSFPFQEDLFGLGKVNHTMDIGLDMSTYCSGGDSFTMAVVVYASVSNNETYAESPNVAGASYVIGPAVDTYGVSVETGGSWSYMELTVDCTCNGPTASPSYGINLAPPLEPEPSDSPTASPTYGINLAPPLDPTPPHDDHDCLCVDEFVSETTADYIVSTQELDLRGMSVFAHSRRITEMGATFVDAILVVAGDTSFEVSSSGYFLDGVETSLPASFLGYSITETIEGYDKTVKLHFGSGFLALISRQGSSFTKMLMDLKAY